MMWLGSLSSSAQDVSSLPLTSFPAKIQDTSKPMIVYISGDGGLNSFSKEYAQALSDKGYPVILFNSLKYFWSKKTPQQAAVDAEKTLLAYKATFKKSKVIIMGYSFGADVLPFIYTRLTRDVQALVKSMVLIAPSNTTDFEVHLTQMLGRSDKKGVSVFDEINKITDKPLLIVESAKEEGKVETSRLKIRNYKLLSLSGGHHFENGGGELANVVLKNL